MIIRLVRANEKNNARATVILLLFLRSYYQELIMAILMQ